MWFLHTTGSRPTPSIYSYTFPAHRVSKAGYASSLGDSHPRMFSEACPLAYDIQREMQ
jgi:hypothetical protein